MKLPAVFLLLLAPVSGFTHGKKPGTGRREVVEGSDAKLGGKGKKGKGKGVASCAVPISNLFRVEDVDGTYLYFNDIGYGLKQVPFFDPVTLEQLGTYSDFTVDVPDSEECIGTGAFSFGTPGADGTYSSQVEISYTCSGQQNAVTGGTGEYGCASGYEKLSFLDENAGLLESELTICGPLCPSVA